MATPGQERAPRGLGLRREKLLPLVCACSPSSPPHLRSAPLPTPAFLFTLRFFTGPSLHPAARFRPSPPSSGWAPGPDGWQRANPDGCGCVGNDESRTNAGRPPRPEGNPLRSLSREARFLAPLNLALRSWSIWKLVQQGAQAHSLSDPCPWLLPSPSASSRVPSSKTDSSRGAPQKQHLEGPGASAGRASPRPSTRSTRRHPSPPWPAGCARGAAGPAL